MLVDLKNQLNFKPKFCALGKILENFIKLFRNKKQHFVLFEAKTQYLRFVKSPKKLYCISTYNLCSVGSPNPSFVNTKNREITSQKYLGYILAFIASERSKIRF